MYRNRTFHVILLTALLGTLLFAQKRPAKRGPRATAIVVMQSDGKTPKELIPIVIRDNDRFWDASIYQASPRPMALEPGVVYEVQRSGQPVGLFIVRTPINENGVWAARGKWQPPRSDKGPLAKLPIADPDVPVLRRTKPPEDDEERPKARKPLSAPESPDQDPERPELKRGKPEATPAPSPTPSAPAVTKPASPAPPAAKAPELLTAVSDAAGPDSHGFLVDLKPDELARLRDAVTSLAQAAVVKEAVLPANTRIEIKNPSLRLFDLDGNNNPEVVLNAVASVAPPPAKGSKARPEVAKEFYVTVIGKEDLSGELHPAYTRVVSARNAEFDGRLELVDAVDVDGDGRGELLFRRLFGRDVSYLVLKVGLRETTALFDSSGR